ncbi:MAG TPA: secretin and TonB N-terminal domain-containing protein [Thermoanaerobaculia bacterium]|nr:secretin and TonB N-terminal domain-containing protein [Thermoanaerobaculia bacterium]
MRPEILLLLAATRSPGAPAHPAAPGAVVAIGESGRRYRGEPISLDLKDADLVDVCLSFSKIAKTNVVVDPGVKGIVTVRLKAVPWDQALDLILRMNGLAMAREGRILRIGRPEALAR